MTCDFRWPYGQNKTADSGLPQEVLQLIMNCLTRILLWKETIFRKWKIYAPCLTSKFYIYDDV
jgi:hypothetical protein